MQAEPSEIRAGNSWFWRRDDLFDYPASAGWSLTYHFRNASAFFDVAASSDGVGYVITVGKDLTESYAAGDYDWVAVVDNGTDRHEVGRGRLTVLPDYSVASALDGRSVARTLLEAVDAILANRATSDQLDLVESAAGDRSLKRDTAGLLKLRSQLRSEVAREENAERIRQGLGSKNKLLVRFNRA
jgi:hypothetical protein